MYQIHHLYRSVRLYHLDLKYHFLPKYLLNLIQMYQKNQMFHLELKYLPYLKYLMNLKNHSYH